jgi:lipoprotein signal peptidase
MLVSGLVWQQGVPDPLVGGGYAFNLADIAIALGDAMLLAAVLVHAWDNRRSLRQTI